MSRADSPRTPASELRELLDWFQSAVTHPAGIAARPDAAPIDAVIAPSLRQTSAERLAVYANSYWARLLACLEEEFPTLRVAVGPEAFAALAVGYLEAHPSNSYTLGRLSHRFVDDLSRTAPAAGDGHAAWAQAVIEIARLEHAVTEVFDAPGGETLGYLTPADLRAIPPERQSDLRLSLLPTVRLLAFDHDVNAYFTAVRGLSREEHSSETPSPPWPAARPTCVALSRRDFIVRRRELSHAEYALLSAIAAGATLGAAIEHLADDPRVDFEAAAPCFGRWFADWAEAGFFQSLAPVAA